MFNILYLMICQTVVIACLCCPQVGQKSVTRGLNALMGFSEIVISFLQHLTS